MVRNKRHQEHRALRKWIIYTRERTEKLKNSCALMVHSLIRMRNFALHRSFRKWLEAGRKEEQAKQQKVRRRRRRRRFMGAGCEFC